MAKQLQATIVLPNGLPTNTQSFPTDEIRIVEVSNNANIAASIFWLGAIWNVEETVTALLALANTSGTSMIQATIWQEGQGSFRESLQMSFPCTKIQIGDSTGSNINSVIHFRLSQYTTLTTPFYAEETEDTLVTAANAGGGGGSETLQEVLDNGAALNKVNRIDQQNNVLAFDNADLHVWAGTTEDAQSGKFGELFVSNQFADLYEQDIDGNAYSNVQCESQEHSFNGYYAALEAGKDSNLGYIRVKEDGIIYNHAKEGTDITNFNIKGISLEIDGDVGASGTFTSQDGKTIIVLKGIITSIT